MGPQAMVDPADRGKGVIVSGILNDIHSLGLYVVEQALGQMGYRVVRLGTMISQEEFIAAARETAADALLVSSSNGHGEVDFQGFGDKCREAGLGDLSIYAGGMITVVADDWARVAQALEGYGVRRVFPPGSELSDVLKVIGEDLARSARVSPFPRREGGQGVR